MNIQSKLICLFAMTACAVSAYAQQEVGVPWTGELGITESVKTIMARNDGENRVPNRKGSPIEPIVKTSQNPDSSTYPYFPNLGQASDGGLSIQAALPFTLSTSFTATTSATSGWYPPDTNFAVGPTQVGVAINGRVKFLTKAGAVSSLDSSLDAFFVSVRGTTNAGDPRIRYDRTSGRWIIIAFNFQPSSGVGNKVLVAVSSGPTIVNTASFTFFSFQHDLVGTAGTDSGGFYDYPSLGVDEDALYIGGNVFNSAAFGVTDFIIRKSSVLGAGPIVVTAFRNLDDGTDGCFSPQGIDHDEIGTNEGYLMGDSTSSFGKLVIHRIGDPGGTPTLTRVPVTTTTTSDPADAPALGTTRLLDTVGDRLFSVQIRKNRLTGVESIWTAQCITVDATGVAVAGNTVGGRTAGKWYQIGNFAGTPVVTQSGTVFDGAASNPNFYFFPAVVQNGQGHALMGFSDSSAIKNTGVSMTGRLSSDTLGLMSDVTSVVAGASSYVDPFTSTVQRWGDYCNSAVDPVDDQTFWSAQEFVSATNTWAIRVFKVLAPAPATISSVVPSTLQQGQTGTVTVNGTVVGGSGFFDPGAGFTNRLSASLGANVTLNSFTFVSPTQMTANFTVAPTATVGARTLTVTNPDGQTSTFAFSITAASNPVPVLSSISPTSVTSLRGSFTLTVNGSNFVNGASVVNVGGAPRATTFVSSTQLTATVLAGDVTTSGTKPVTVVTSVPGGGTSGAQTLTIIKTTISGNIALQNWLPGTNGQTPTILLYNGVTNIPITASALNGSGNYSFSLDIAPGTYSVFAKGSHWLRSSGPVVVAAPSTATAASLSLINGDINNDNFVGFDDFDILSAGFGLSLGDPGYTPAADLNGDDFIGFDDFDILSAHFGEAGDDLP